MLYNIKNTTWSIMLLLLLPILSTAQGREVTPYYPNIVTCLGPTPTAVDLRFRMSTNESVRWSGSGSLPLPLAFPATVTATEFAIAGNIEVGITTPGDYPFTITATITGVGSWSRNYVLKVRTSCTPTCPGTRDYVLLLDQSGSMGGPAAGGGTKWDVLKSAVKDFLPNLVINAGLSADDRLYVAFFGKNDPDQLDVVGNWGFDESWITRANDIDQRLFQYSPGVNRMPEGMTPLGGGLQQAFTSFFGSLTPPFPAAPDKMRNVIIFTDGMQNQNPVTGDPNILADPHNDVTNIAGFLPVNGVLGTPGINIPLTGWGNKFRIFTIGVGASPGFRDQLRKIAEPEDLYAQTDVVNDMELRRFFNLIIPNSLKECSPRLLDYRTVSVATDAMQNQKFVVNRFVERLTIKVNTNSKISNEPNPVRLLKDGVVVAAPFTNNGSSLMYVLDFPLQHSAPGFDETGVWELQFFANKGDRYDIFAMVEDKSISAKLDVGGGKVYFPGKDIPISVDLTYDGKAIADATVEGILLRPGEDLGDLAARRNIALTGMPLEPGQDPGQQKIDLLMKDPSFYYALSKTGSIVSFKHQGNGKYTHTFKAGAQTGTYQVVVLFKGSAVGSNNYQGYESKCILVDFGEASDIELNTIRDCKVVGFSDGVRIHQCSLTFMPTNRFGKRLGPGQGNRIKLQSPQVTFTPLVDKLDGSYQTTLKYSGSSPDISIYVADGARPVYDGKLRSINRPWGLSAHAGLTAPLKGLDSLYENGLYAGLDLTYKMKPGRWLELMGAYYTFSPKYDVIGVNLSYKGVGSIRPAIFGSFSAGLGLFKPKEEDLQAGLSGRAGLLWKPNSSWMLGLDGGLYYLTKKEAYFATGGISIHYFF